MTDVGAMDTPKEINFVFWDNEKKSWEYKIVPVEEYHGWTECQYCNKQTDLDHVDVIESVKHFQHSLFHHCSIDLRVTH